MTSIKFKDHFKKLVKKNKNVDEICSILKIKRKDLNNIFHELRICGDNYVIEGNYIIMKKTPTIHNKTYKFNCDKDHIKLLLLGDTHLANKESRIDLLEDLYDIAEKENIDYALNCGDVVDGYTLKYKDFMKSVFIYTYDGQKQYVIEKYPSFSGKTLMVSGNHDDWWFRHTNKEILFDVATKRDDMFYLGANAANIEIGNLKINLLHGNIIPSTSEYFNLEKHISNLDYIPNIIHYGHAHSSGYQNYKEIECYMTPSLMNETSYCSNKERGAYFIDVYMDDFGNVEKISKKEKIYK